MASAAGALEDYISKIKTEGLKASGNTDMLAYRDLLKKKKGLGG